MDAKDFENSFYLYLMDKVPNTSNYKVISYYEEPLIKFFKLGFYYDAIPEILMSELLYHADDNVITPIMRYVYESNYNNWFTTNQLGLIHFFKTEPHLRKCIQMLYINHANLYGHEIKTRTFLKHVVEMIRQNELIFDPYFYQLSLTYASNEDIRNELLRMNEEFKFDTTTKWWRVDDKKCEKLTDDELQRYQAQVYDDEKLCLDSPLQIENYDPQAIKSILEEILVLCLNHNDQSLFETILRYENDTYDFDFQKIFERGSFITFDFDAHFIRKVLRDRKLPTSTLIMLGEALIAAKNKKYPNDLLIFGLVKKELENLVKKSR